MGGDANEAIEGLRGGIERLAGGQQLYCLAAAGQSLRTCWPRAAPFRNGNLAIPAACKHPLHRYSRRNV